MIRAARFLKKTLGARRKVANSVKNVYTLRSDPVHTGRLDLLKKIGGEEPLSILSEGRKTIARAFRKAIHLGQIPDWNAIAFD
jgi:hypothetical protein